jgi:hypothetical protein
MPVLDTMVYDNTVTPAKIRRIAVGDTLSSKGAVYTHTQTVPALAWSIQHNLGIKTLDIKTFLPTGEEIIGDPDWLAATDNHITINFSSALMGKAFIRPL